MSDQVLLSVDIPGTPQPQGSKRHVGGGRLLESNDEVLRPWRATMTTLLRAAIPVGWERTGPMCVALSFRFARPLAHLKKDGTLRGWAPWWKHTRPDVDKLARAVLDAGTDAGVWLDDGQVASLIASKSWGEPGVGIEVRPLVMGVPNAGR